MFGILVMLVDLPKNLSPHVAGANMSVGIGEFLCIRNQRVDVVRGLGEGKCVESILDDLESVEIV